MSDARRSVVFLDRDGTINEDVDFLSDPAQLVLIDGVGEAIARLNRTGRAVVVVTNQSGVARGLFDLEAVARIHRALDRLLGEQGARVDGYYVCPHHPDFDGPCRCRKPGTALVEQAIDALELTLEDALVAGDKPTDVELGFALGVRTALVRTGYGAESTRAFPDARGRTPTLVAPALPDVVDWLLEGGTAS